MEPSQPEPDPEPDAAPAAEPDAAPDLGHAPALAGAGSPTDARRAVMTAMVVADDPLGAQLLQVLAAAGHRGRRLGSADDLRAALREGGRPDIVLLQVPAGAAAQLCRTLRGGPARTMQLIALAAADHADDALGAGFDDVIVTPVEMPELRVRLGVIARVHTLAARAAAGRRPPQPREARETHVLPSRRERFAAAVEAAMDRLAAAGPYLPSLYMRRGGRLRCVGVRGSAQVVDGLYPGTGVVGTAVSTGRAAVIGDAASAGRVPAAADGPRAQVCVPLRHEGEVVGALDVQSDRPIDTAGVGSVFLCAWGFEADLAEIGGPPAETVAEQVARYSAQLAGTVEPAEIERYTLDSARALSRMESAMIAIREDLGGFAVTAADGLLAERLATMTPAQLQTMAGWVRDNASCYSYGGRSRVLDYQPVRDAGASSMIVLGLSAREQQLGFLLCADSERVLPAPEEVEHLELLATQAATALLTVAGMEELRSRAARDSLTGLGHRAAFEAEIARQLSDRRGLPLAVMVIDLDGFKAVNDTHGHQAGDRALRELAVSMSSSLRADDLLYRIGGDEFAALFTVYDDRAACALGERLCAAARASGSVTVSVGIALAAAGEEPTAVIDRADQALYDVKRKGRDGVSVAATGGLPGRRPGDR